MSGVKRYEFEVDDRYLCDCGNGSRIIPVAIDTGEYVLASDYDRDTQALKDELDNIKRSWGLLNSERDELRAQVEVMRKLLVDARRYVDKAWPDGVHSYRTNSVSGDLLSKIDAALQGDKT